jgi:thiol-disulfide isomerase/thioredoxin
MLLAADSPEVFPEASPEVSPEAVGPVPAADFPLAGFWEGFCCVMVSCFALGFRHFGRRFAVSSIATAWLAIAGTMNVAGAAEPPKFTGLAGDFSPIDPPLQIPAPSFQDKLGQPLTLGDFHGKVVLLNFWATWCPPCVAEMPALDKLQADLGGDGFQVVAVSTDRQGIKVSAPFYRRIGLSHLALYNDTRGNLFGALSGKNLPTSFLIDRNGHVVGTLEGPAQWDSEKAKALIEHYMKDGAS